jgi:DNA modification methylase
MSQVLTGDALEVLRTLPEKIAQTCVTSPPYWGLRDYGTAEWVGGDTECDHQYQKGGRDPKTSSKQISNGGTVFSQYEHECKKCGAVRIDRQLGLEKTPEEYVTKLVEIFREVKRVLRKDGTLWLNLGDSYSGSGRGRDADGTWNPGKGGSKQETNTGSTIGRVVNAKSFSKKLIEAGATGNAWVKPPQGLKCKDLVGIPWRVAFALQADGWYLRSDIIWSKPNPMPESVTDRPTKAHEYIFLLTKSARYYYDADAVAEEANYDGRKDEIMKGSVKYGNGYSPTTSPQTMSIVGHERWKKDDNGTRVRNRRTVWHIATQPRKEAHFATFPDAIPEICIKAGSKKGDIVLEPFGGSGTTAQVAKRLGREYIIIELNPKYVKDLIEPSLASINPLFSKEP